MACIEGSTIRTEVAVARLLMAALALMNLGFSIWVFFAPGTISAFVGLTMSSVDAQSEVRAMYGGLIGGLGIINLLGALNPARLNSAFWATAWAFTGVGIVRFLSCLYFSISGWQLLFSLSELAASIVCFWWLRKMENTV